MSAPFQGLRLLRFQFPGRWPGLICFAPVGALFRVRFQVVISEKSPTFRWDGPVLVGKRRAAAPPSAS